MGLFRKSKKSISLASTPAEEQAVHITSSKPSQVGSLPTDDDIYDPIPTSTHGKAIVTSQGSFKPSEVFDKGLHGKQNTGYKYTRPTAVPSAKESAFSGPVRYDWVDVESSAAVKIQSIFRRNQALDRLEKEGKTTASMRNKVRKRQAGTRGKASEDTPTFLRFCGLGMIFSDATGEDNLVLNDDDAMNNDELVGLSKKKMQTMEEKEKKARKFRMRKKSSDQIEEAIEVVDNIELGEEKEAPVKSKKGFFRKSKK